MSDSTLPATISPTFKGGQEKKMAEELPKLLIEGETALAAMIAQPRGATQAVAGAHLLGQMQAGKHQTAAKEAGLVLARPMGLVLTNLRLLTVKISMPIGLGIGGKVQEVLSAVPLSDITSIESKHWKIGQSLTITIGESEFKLEMNARASGPALAEAFTALTGR